MSGEPTIGHAPGESLPLSESKGMTPAHAAAPDAKAAAGDKGTMNHRQYAVASQTSSVPTAPCDNADESSCPQSTCYASEPVRDLADVSYRLKKLEKAVKTHLLGSRVAGDSSILSSSSAGQQVGAATFGSPMSARASERAQLRSSLSAIKADLADLAAKEVEGQLLQQRVARLEAAIGGLTMTSSCGFSSGFASLASSIAGTAGPATIAQGADIQQAGRTLRAPPDMSVLVDRLSGMEGLMKELAQAQVANTAVLQQIGGRLGSSPVHNEPLAQHPCPASHAHSVYYTPPRPPSCPLISGPLNNPFGHSSPPHPQSRRRAPSPDPYYCPSWTPGASARNSHTPTVSASPGPGIQQTAHSHAASQQEQQHLPFGPLEPQVYPHLQGCSHQQQSQQEQLQQEWQVKLVLASHDAELAAIKESVSSLKKEYDATAAVAVTTAVKLADLMASADSGNKVTMTNAAVESDQVAPSPSGAQPELTSLANTAVAGVTEHLSADLGQTESRLDRLEEGAAEQQQSIQTLNSQCQQLQEQCLKVENTPLEHGERVSSIGASQGTELVAATSAAQLPGQLEQLLSSPELCDLITARVKVELQRHLPEALAQHMAAAGFQGAARWNQSTSRSNSIHVQHVMLPAPAAIATAQDTVAAPIHDAQPVAPVQPASNESAFADMALQQPDFSPSCVPIVSAVIADNVAASVDQADDQEETTASVPAQAGVSLVTRTETSTTSNEGALSTETSSDALTSQVAALQADISCRELQSMQMTIEVLSKQVTVLQQSLTAQAAMLEHQRVSAAATFTVLAPLEPQVRELESQVALIKTETVSAQQATALESRLDTLQAEIQQLSGQLAEVNESAAQESDFDDLKADIASLQQQLQDHAAKAHIAAVATDQEEVAATEVQDNAHDAPAASETLASSLQQIVISTQQEITTLRVDLEARLSEISNVTDNLVSVVAEQGIAGGQLSTQTNELASELAELANKVTDSSMKLADVVAQVESLTADLIPQHEDVDQRLQKQADAISELHHQLETFTNSQQSAASERQTVQEAMTAELHQTVHQLQDSFTKQLGTVQDRLTSATMELAEHEKAIDRCATADALTSIAATLHELPGTVEGVSCKQEVLEQAQRVAECQLQAAHEQLQKIAAQLASLQSISDDLQATIDHGQTGTETELEHLKHELMELQQQKFSMQQFQERQHMAIQQLDNLVKTTRAELLDTLARDSRLLAEGLDELHAAVSEQDQLWIKMQAVFDANKARAPRVSALFKTRASQSLTVSPQPSATKCLHEQLAATLPDNATCSTVSATSGTGSVLQGSIPAETTAPDVSTDGVESPEQAPTAIMCAVSSTMTEYPNIMHSAPSAAAERPTAFVDGLTTDIIAVPAQLMTVSVALQDKLEHGQGDAIMAAQLQQQFDRLACDMHIMVERLQSDVTSLQEQYAMTSRSKELACGTAAETACLAELTNSTTQLQQQLNELAAEVHNTVAQLLLSISAVPKQHAMTDMVAEADSDTVQLQGQIESLAAEVRASTSQLTERIQAMERVASTHSTACTEDEEVVPISIVLVLQQQLAKVTLQVEDLANKLTQQTATPAIADPTAKDQVSLSMQHVGSDAAITEPATVTQMTSSDGSIIAIPKQVAQYPTEWMPAAHQQQLLGELSADKAAQQGDKLLQQQTPIQSDVHITDTTGSTSHVGVLHAPLSLVVQLQSELEALRDTQIKKEQFSAVVRMVKELQEKVNSLPGSAGADGISSKHLGTHAVLQQHTEQLTSLADSMQLMIHRMEAAETMQQQQQQCRCSIPSDLSDLQISHQRVVELSAAQNSLLADFSKLQTLVNDLAARVPGALPGVVAVNPRSPSQEALGADFSGMMAGLSNFKRHMDEQLQLVLDLQQRLQAQEAAVASLLTAAATASDTITATSVQQVHAASTDCCADVGADDSTAAVDRNEVERIDMDDRVQALSLQLKDILVRLDAHDCKLSILMHPQPPACNDAGGKAQVTADTTTPSVMFSRASFMNSISKISSITESDAMELTAAAVGEAAEVVAEPISLVHSFLKELKVRLERLEATAYDPGNRLSTPPNKASSTRAARVRQATGHRPSNDSFTMSELHDLVVELQGEVACIEETSISQAAVLQAIQGDVAAAAAAAAAAMTAAERAPPTHLAVDSVAISPACVAAEQSAAHAAATAAGEAASAALLKAQSAEQGLSELSKNLQQCKEQWYRSMAVEDSTAYDFELSKLQADLAAVRHDLQDLTQVPDRQKTTEGNVTALQSQLQICLSRLCTLEETASRTIAAPDQAARPGTQVQEANVQQISLELQDMKQQVQMLATAVEKVTEAQQVYVQYAQPDRRQDEVSAHTGSVGCSTCCLAADQEATRSIRHLEEALTRLQDQVAWVATEAASAAAKTVAGAVEELQHQLDSLQEQVGQCSGPETRCTSAGSESIQAGHSHSFQPCDSFGKLASRSCTADGTSQPATESATPGGVPQVEHAHHQQESNTEVTDDCAEGWWSQQTSDADTVCGGQQRPTAAERDISQQAAEVQASAQTTATGCCMESATSNKAADPSRCNLDAVGTSAAAEKDTSFQQLLVQELDSMSPVQQGALLSKLAMVVSAHAARLLATYHTDPELAKQITQIQQHLSVLPPPASSSGAATGPSGSPNSSLANFARCSSNRGRLTFSMSAASRTPAEFGASGSVEVLLGILDQVASLRAIGSATHPAINKALQKHEAQLLQLSSAVFQLQQTNNTSPGLSVMQAPDTDSVTATECSDSLVAASEAAAGTTPSLQTPATSSPQTHATVSVTAGGCTSGADDASCSECSRRLSVVELQLANGLKVLSELQDRLAPIQEVADATQSMMRELQVANGLVLQRLEVLEKLAESAVVADSTADSTQAGSLTIASLLRKVQDDSVVLSRRLSAAESNLASVTECLGLTRRMAARLADTDARCAQLASRVSGMAGALPVLVDRVASMEGCQSRALTTARRGLDILADQLVALGALSGRSSPNRNPLAALGPNHGAISALEGKLEAVRTAMTASVRFMMEKLAVESASMGNLSAAPGYSQAELGAGVVASQVAASEAVNAAVMSHQDALNRLEAQIAQVRTEMHLADRSTAASPSWS